MGYEKQEAGRFLVLRSSIFDMSDKIFQAFRFFWRFRELRCPGSQKDYPLTEHWLTGGLVGLAAVGRDCSYGTRDNRPRKL